ncbi:MAG: FHA domain-containing protein, partial [Nitrospirae bacterium]
MSNLIGQTLERYSIDSLLGQGGMGKVYKAYDSRLERDVAIKVIHEHLMQRTDVRARFLQEARSAAQITHPNIVHIYSLGEIDTLLYIVMEYVPGGNLRQMLDKLRRAKQWLPIPEAVFIVRQLALAIDHAHRMGIVHRDIKPANIMLRPDPAEGVFSQPVLTDLGIAKVMNGGFDTQPGSSLGTPSYMAPEQATGDGTTAATDIYALGILLHELLVGRVPFPAKGITDLMRYYVREQAPRVEPRKYRRDLPEGLVRILVRALERKPDDRYPTARDLATALDRLSKEALTTSVPEFAEGGVVALETVYDRDLVAGFRSVPPEMSAPSGSDAGPGVEAIRVVDENGNSFIHKIEGRLITVGRDPENDLVLEDTQVSRQHVRIEFDGPVCKVIDQRSTNGTYLDTEKLLPGIVEIWEPTKVLRIAGYRLHLEETYRVSEASEAIDVTQMSGTKELHTNWKESICLSTPFSHYFVKPGETIDIDLTVLTDETDGDHFDIICTGIPEDWFSIRPSSIHLGPGEQGQVTLKIHPPRSPRTRAARHSFKISALSRRKQPRAGVLELALTVGAFVQFDVEMRPQQIKCGDRAKVYVHNWGNHTEQFAIGLKDSTGELQFEPRGDNLLIGPGQTGAMEFVVRCRSGNGAFAGWQFTARVKAASGEGKSIEGRVSSEAKSGPRKSPSFVDRLLGGFIGLLGIGILNSGTGILDNATLIPMLIFPMLILGFSVGFFVG